MCRLVILSQIYFYNISSSIAEAALDDDIVFYANFNTIVEVCLLFTKLVKLKI